MPSTARASSFGRVFNEIAAEYDRHRPRYPDALIDRACEVAGIEPGSRVLEVGCGTGQLTGSLLARGLRVTAVEPGARLIAQAHHRLPDLGSVQFVNARFEDAGLPHAHFEAAFFASALHWLDPDVSWDKTSSALVDGGTLALVSYFGLEEALSAEDQQALRSVIQRIAPDVEAAWPTYRDLDATLSGAEARRNNVSEVWAWLGDYAVARGNAASLFEDVQVAAVPMLLEHTGKELNDLLATMSFWAGLSPQQREAVAAENDSLYERLARPIRSSAVAVLVTARRTARTDQPR